jgi:hypothetical protein
MDCKAEKKARAQRAAKWLAVNADELTAPVFGPRAWKRLERLIKRSRGQFRLT